MFPQVTYNIVVNVNRQIRSILVKLIQKIRNEKISTYRGYWSLFITTCQCEW